VLLLRIAIWQPRLTSRPPLLHLFPGMTAFFKCCLRECRTDTAASRHVPLQVRPKVVCSKGSNERAEATRRGWRGWRVGGPRHMRADAKPLHDPPIGANRFPMKEVDVFGGFRVPLVTFGNKTCLPQQLFEVGPHYVALGRDSAPGLLQFGGPPSRRRLLCMFKVHSLRD
jgi:hypothetical protein